MLCHQRGEDDEVCPWPTSCEVPPESNSIREYPRGLSLNFHWRTKHGGTRPRQWHCQITDEWEELDVLFLAAKVTTAAFKLTEDP